MALLSITKNLYKCIIIRLISIQTGFLGRVQPKMGITSGKLSKSEGNAIYIRKMENQLPKLDVLAS